MNFNQCPNKPFDPSGMEVVFTGDGTEIGRANTDSNGDASFVWHHVGFGNHHIVASSNHCGAEFDVTLYDDCTRHACLNGRGKIAGKTDPYMVFSYETHVNAGVLEMANTMSLTDGPESFTNVPVEWVVVLNTEVYFGNDHIVFHTIDNGKAPGVDYIEVWDTQTGYYNSGTLLNGQIRTSWGIYKPGDPHKAMP